MLKIDEYVLVEITDGGDSLKIVTNGYDNLEDIEHSMTMYPDTKADIRIIAFMA